MDSTTLKELLKYDGAEFPKKEIKLPLQSVWEYLGYLEISLDCFKLAIQHLDADFFMITSQIGFFSKEKIEDFISNNGYQQCNEEICSFELFNKQIYYDGNLLYKLSCEDLMEKYLLEEHKQILGYDALNAPLKKNIIENGYYRIDEFPHIKNQKYKNDFFRFFTDKGIFQELYECAKSEKKEITDFSILLNSKLQLLNNKLCGFSEELISHLTNQTLIHWYILLQKHIGNAMSLLTDSSVNKIDTKQIVYIIKSLFEYYLDVDTKEVSFVEFTRNLVGTTYSTAEKYLRSPTMGYKETPFTNNWIEVIELLDKLDTENPKVREFIRFILEEKYRQKKGLSHDLQTKINGFIAKYP